MTCVCVCVRDLRAFSIYFKSVSDVVATMRIISAMNFNGLCHQPNGIVVFNMSSSSRIPCASDASSARSARWQSVVRALCIYSEMGDNISLFRRDTWVSVADSIFQFCIVDQRIALSSSHRQRRFSSCLSNIIGVFNTRAMTVNVPLPIKLATATNHQRPNIINTILVS